MKTPAKETPKILLGFEKLKKQLQPLLESPLGGRFFLIEGPQGTGRLDIACELAREWSGNSPLIQEPENPKSGYSVDQIRKLCQEIQEAGLGQGKLVYILKNFELMSPVSANSWLKSLEELPSHVWIIALALPSQVLPTLLSRALRLKTHLSSSDVLKQWLHSAGYFFDEKQWQAIDLYAAGSAAKAINYFDEKVQKRLSLTHEFAVSAKWSEAQALARKIESFASDDEGPKLDLWKEIIAVLAASWNISQSSWTSYQKWLDLLKSSELAISRHLKMASVLERLWIDKDLWKTS